MSLNIAVSCKNNQAYLFAGSMDEDGKPSIVDIQAIDLVSEAQEGIVSPIDLEEVFGDDVENVVAILPSQRILFERITLPFKDPRHVEKILPLQIQNRVPFEMDQFVVDSCLSSETETGSFNHLSSFVPKSVVAESLQTFSSVGIQPSFLTNNAYALAGIAAMAPDAFPSFFAIIEIQSSFASIVIINQSCLHSMRELSASTSCDAKQLISDLQCSLSESEETVGKNLEKIFIVGDKEAAKGFTTYSKHSGTYLDLNNLLPSTVSNLDLNEFPATLGLIGHECFPNYFYEKGEINFRQGDFAYKPTLGNVIAAAEEHFWSIVGAATMGLLLVISQYFLEVSQLHTVEKAINNAAQAALPTEAIPEGTEREALQAKVFELEDQLKNMGSLSSLSPLNSLRELSEVIPRSLDTRITSLKITASNILLRGTLPNSPDIGSLETRLVENRNRFCKSNQPEDLPVVKSDRQIGRRQHFSAEIKICE